MLQAIALAAVAEAARHGAYRASFRGFRVHARRWFAADDSPDAIAVDLLVHLGERLVEREWVPVGFCRDPTELEAHAAAWRYATTGSMLAARPRQTQPGFTQRGQ